MSAGALDTETNEYVLPRDALKERRYHCVDCGDRVIPRQGDVRVHHFAHNVKNNCTYFEHPNESQVHKDAKYRLAEMLKQKKKIEIGWECQADRCQGSNYDEINVLYTDGDEVRVEFRGPGGSYVADVALVNGGNPRYIFEIKNTHATTTERPEPWYEFDAKDLLKDELDTLYCRRPGRECLGCRTLKEVWIYKVPTIYPAKFCKDNWEQNKKCILCDRIRYSPVFAARKYRALCKICLEETDELKKRFSYSSQIENQISSKKWLLDD